MEKKYNVKDFNFVVDDEICPRCKNNGYKTVVFDIDKPVDYKRVISMRNIKLMLLKVLPNWICTMIFKVLKNDATITINDNVKIAIKIGICPECENKSAEIVNFELGDYDII